MAEEKNDKLIEETPTPSGSGQQGGEPDPPDPGDTTGPQD